MLAIQVPVPLAWRSAFFALPCGLSELVSAYMRVYVRIALAMTESFGLCLGIGLIRTPHARRV